jgi:hypothetical protein
MYFTRMVNCCESLEPALVELYLIFTPILTLSP